jgi:hypothetical protein
VLAHQLGTTFAFNSQGKHCGPHNEQMLLSLKKRKEKSVDVSVVAHMRYYVEYYHEYRSWVPLVVVVFLV